jgi:uncharacterized repeat protein (TIGR01451 family)
MPGSGVFKRCGVGSESQMRLNARWQTPVTLLALAGAFAALLYAPVAEPAPGDIADLAVSKTDSPDPVSVGSTLTYTIQVSNLGPEGATGVTVTDRLPSQVKFVSAMASSGSCTGKGRTINCDVGSLAADPTKANAATVTIAVQPKKVGTIVSSASVKGVEKDPVSANDQAQTSTTVTAPAVLSSCRGIPTTLTGTRKADRLVGTAGPDVIAGLEGNDSIFGLDGRDLICTGAGNDRAGAGSASDRVFGGVGADRLSGGRGGDLVAGNPGGDVLFGNHGNDRLRGGAGSDLCFGSAGFDRIRTCDR